MARNNFLSAALMYGKGIILFPTCILPTEKRKNYRRGMRDNDTSHICEESIKRATYTTLF